MSKRIKMSKRMIKEDCERDVKMDKDNSSPGRAKIQEDCEDVRMREDDFTPGESDNLSISRKQIYDEACREIRKCLEAVERTKLKIDRFKDHVDDFHFTNGMSCINEVSNQMEEAIDSFQECGKHWVSFLAIPKAPMRHILKYLKFEDKANFRLTSRIHMAIVDYFDDDFKSVTFYYRDREDLEDVEILGTRKDISVVCRGNGSIWSDSDAHEESENDSDNDDDEWITKNRRNRNRRECEVVDAECFPDILDRLVGLSGSPKHLGYMRSASRVERINLAYGNCYPQQMININRSASSLKVLTLQDVNLSRISFDRLPLPNLERLDLYSVTGYHCVLQLLVSCSSSLEHLSLQNISSVFEFFSFDELVERGTQMTRLKKIEIEKCSYLRGMNGLLESASNSLKCLVISSCEGRFSNPEKLDFSLPKLEMLKLEICDPQHLSVLSCPAPRLKTVTLCCMAFPTDVEINCMTAVTELSMVDLEDEEGCSKLLSAASDTLQDLYIHGVELSEFTKTFPELRKFRTDDVLCQSSCLKDLDIRIYGDRVFCDHDRVDVSGVEKLAIRKWRYLMGADTKFSPDGMNLMLSKMTDSLKELAFFGVDLPTFEVKQLNLTKLSVTKSACALGLCDLLNVCSSTLEELCISRSFSEQPLDLQGLQVMQVLKIITIQCPNEKECQNVFSRLNELLKQCGKSLEKLVLEFPHEEKCSISLPIESLFPGLSTMMDRDRKKSEETNKLLSDQRNNLLLTLDLNLPNLKILQIYPRPADSVFKQISRQLPKDVTLWFFPPQIELTG